VPNLSGKDVYFLVFFLLLNYGLNPAADKKNQNFIQKKITYHLNKQKKCFK